MGYQALLFCPDEKIARTVTQVLSELEFTVDACVEPFAAVKKLMGQHFDAVVVDCDNEQNATLLFKSARNSTSNQASLAVAVVEGQAGVAKAFRIGANLVLTKPINVEQAKGTLRVARGLLRKGEPAKPAASAAPGAAPAASTPPPTPAKTIPSATARPSALPPRPIAPPVVKPAVSAATQARNAIDIKGEERAAAPAVSAIVSPSASPAAAAEKPALKVSGPSLGSGAASAPAPAREVREAKVVQAPSPDVGTSDAVIEKPTEAATISPVLSSSSSAAVPTFSFGGGSPESESSDGRKKIFIGVAAVLVVAIGAFVAWGHFQAQKSQVASSAASPAAAAPKPVTPAPAPVAATPASPAAVTPAPTSQPVTQPSAASPAPSTTALASNAAANVESASSNGNSAGPASASGSKAAAASAQLGSAPLVVKGGAGPKTQTKAAALDAAAPSMIGIATPGSGGLPNLVEESSAPKPVLQTLNVSQGVSQGLVVKKVQPVYPRNALTMHVEGTVQLMATISKSGDIGAVKVLSGPPQLTNAAADAVKQWKYKPYLLNGEPVDIQTQVTVVFKLPR
jgi:periplasmic protein TonB